jgi:hypothetical protein
VPVPDPAEGAAAHAVVLDLLEAVEHQQAGSDPAQPADRFLVGGRPERLIEGLPLQPGSQPGEEGVRVGSLVEGVEGEDEQVGRPRQRRDVGQAGFLSRGPPATISSSLMPSVTASAIGSASRSNPSTRARCNRFRCSPLKGYPVSYRPSVVFFWYLKATSCLLVSGFSRRSLW